MKKRMVFVIALRNAMEKEREKKSVIVKRLPGLCLRVGAS